MNEKVTKARKNNMKLHPIYQMLGIDFLFYYGVKILFLSQVKGISDADIVFSTSAYAFFAIFFQIIFTAVVEKVGRRKSLFIGNLLNCVYLLLIITCTNMIQLVVAEFICSIAFALKNVSEAPMLDASIPKCKQKQEIFAHIDSKGYSRYYYMSAITTIMAGYLYKWNPYIPMFCALACNVIAVMISFNFIDIEEVEELEGKEKKTIGYCFKEVKEGFTFIIKSKRLKALLLMFGLIWGFVSLFSTYETTLLKNMNVSSEYIGMITAGVAFIKAWSIPKTTKFHQKFRNKSLACLILNCTIGAIIAGTVAILQIPFSIQIIIILSTYATRSASKGMFQIIKKRYMGNFADAKILPKIYSVEKVFSQFCRMSLGLVGTMLLKGMSIQYAMIVAGGIFTIVAILVLLYMKPRVGLKPEQYDEKDIVVKI